MACTCRKTFRSMKWASIQPMLIEKKWPSKSLVSLRSYPLSTYFRTCAYQGVRNNSFSENFEYELNKWSLKKMCYKCQKWWNVSLNSLYFHKIFSLRITLPVILCNLKKTTLKFPKQDSWSQQHWLHQNKLIWNFHKELLFHNYLH